MCAFSISNFLTLIFSELLEVPTERIEAICDELAAGYANEQRGFVSLTFKTTF